ncbi:SCF ubiquitin ligase complex [Malassezia pachydermatis]|uniref:F-box domain-containing protein n=1 Tax=Malassezia pachydermatis TaxID=77020 RepID=A0A0M8MK52_9BASI|nr:hypothetical protein Malapachy_3729 [Malassezia pachydermatis]KOS14096.1 hypothetical protein Malapachy_3729 [Malassezia pachydermatis]
MAASVSERLPAEIVQRICEIVYLDSIPLCSLRLLDPDIVPSAAFDAQAVSTSIDDTQQVLYTLCLVNRTFYRYAHPLLYRRVQITLPYRFMLLLDDALSSAAVFPTQNASSLSSIRMLDFSAFRALGLRRTVGESTERRFVTAERLFALIHATTGLVAFGSSETMDSALSLEVLEALLFRDGEASRPSRMRDVSMERGASPIHTALQSLDLCGCTSPKFIEAMHQFVQKHLERMTPRYSMYDVPEESDDAMGMEEETRGRSRRTVHTHARHPSRHRMLSNTRKRMFPSLHRLGLAGVSIPRSDLASFVLSFPNLTHLDLSQTRVDAAMLDCIATSSMQLESLSLSRCRALTSESITNLLISSPVTEGLLELALQGTLLFPTPLSPDDMRTIVTHAPCMRSGNLRFLDLGGCPLSDEELSMIPAQHALLDLGLSAIPTITLRGVSAFLQSTAPNVQVLDLSQSAVPHGHIHAVHLYHELLAPCTQPPPAMEIAEQLKALGLKRDDADAPSTENWTPPTNLRVVELSSAALGTVRGGVGSWKVVWGAGRRGWVVDTGAGPAPQAFDIPVSNVEAASRGRTRIPEQVVPRRPAMSMERSSRIVEEREERGRTPDRRGHGRRPVSRSPFHDNRLAMAAFESRSRSLSLSRNQERQERRVPLMRTEPVHVEPQVIRNLADDHPRRKMLEHVASLEGRVPGSFGWHSHKMEVLLGYGLLGHEKGSYAWFAYQDA